MDDNTEDYLLVDTEYGWQLMLLMILERNNPGLVERLRREL